MPKPADISAIYRAVATYYEGKIASCGATSRGVDWADETSHRTRHAQFLRLLGNERSASVADLGCGYGDFLNFLREHGYSGRYIGYDIAAAMIEAAKKLHGADPDHQWTVGASPQHRTDFVVASGIFNVKQDCAEEAWTSYVWDTIDAMAQAAIRGFGFNVLSRHSDAERRRPDLFYADPVVFFDRATRRYGRKAALLQDYGLYEFTLLIRRD